ncbi:MAG: NUDIX hydrolase [Clostridia bacterium]|nr:NUDIX hydrolase [Clostridia bacterium]
MERKESPKPEHIEKKNENARLILDKKFVRIYDLEILPGKHYYSVTRRDEGDIFATMSDERAREALPDAVTTCVIIDNDGEEPLMMMNYEFRYPVGRFLLGGPAGLIDRSDVENAAGIVDREEYVRKILFGAAAREISEESGINSYDEARFILVSPLVYSTPGMSDESNALVCAVYKGVDVSSLNHNGAEGTEAFDGFSFVNKEEALAIIRSGRDSFGNFFSVYTYCTLMYFVSDMWKNE